MHVFVKPPSPDKDGYVRKYDGTGNGRYVYSLKDKNLISCMMKTSMKGPIDGMSNIMYSDEVTLLEEPE